jgi:hypothetical protein
MAAPNLENLKFYIVVPQAATNYVTNPTPYRAMTGYTAYGGSIAASTISGRRGPLCIKVTPTTAESGVYFGTVSVTDAEDYVFSCDVKGESGKAMRLRVEDAGGTYTYETTFTATGYWQRLEVTFTAEETASDYRLYVLRDATTGTTAFHVDGFQFEVGDEATTFFTGGTKGFGRAPLEFYWAGTPHASISYRTADTRAGGSLLDISSYATLAGVFGLGMGNYKQIYTELASGGAYYQKHIRKPRNFSLLLDYTGSMSEITDNKNTIIEAVRPDYTGYDQPLIIRYQGFDNTNYEATNPVDIICIPQVSHIDPNTECAYNQDILFFTVLDSYLSGAYTEGKGLIEAQNLAVEGIVMRDSEGNWNNMDGGTEGGYVYCMAEAPNGDIYVGGTFTSVNGVANTAYLAKWDGSNWSTVTGTDTLNANVLSLCFDADGNLYIGGAFSNLGDANGDRIVKWDGSSLSSLGTGMNNSVWALAIDPDTGYLYAGGIFTLAGGVDGTALIAYWDGTAWNPLNTGLGTLTEYVQTLKFGPDGNLYIGGSFTDTAYPYICYWDGSSFNPVGTAGDINGTVQAIEFNNTGELIVSGLFTNVASIADADYIAKFNGTSWFPIGTGLNNGGYGIFIDDNNDLYIGGQFTVAGGLTLSDRVAVYSNGSWRMLDIDLPGSDAIQSILIDSRDNLYIGGNFSTTADGNAFTNKVTICTNSGNTKIFPIIEIQGPGVLQSITNYSIGKEIQFDGLTLQAGEIITIQPVSGQVLITSNWGGRGYMQKYVNPGSDIGSFYLKPGTNYISLFMPSDTTAATQAFIYWTPKFWNIEGSRYE